MYDHQMRFLADDHRGTLLAEAERARLAKAARQHAVANPETPARAARRMSLGMLLARMTARVG
jgi:hypothetical protein